MEFNLTAGFLFFGVLNGFVSSFLLLMSKEGKNPSNSILIALLCALSLSLIPTLFGQIGLVKQYDFLHLIPLDFTLFLFPLLYQYLLSITNSNLAFKTAVKHYLIGIVFWLYHVIVWVSTLGVYQKGEVLTSAYFFEIQFISQLIWIFMIFFYAKISFEQLFKTKRMRLSKSQLSYVPWIRRILVFFIVLGLVEFGSLWYGKYYGYWKGSPLDEWLGGSLAMILKCIAAFALYLIAFMGYSRFRKITYLKTDLSTSEVDNYVKKITDAMQVEKHYLNPEFSLSDLASQLNTSTVHVSSILNNVLEVSFNDLINKYRVETVKQKLSTDEINKYTLQSIALSSGFKSKATFYRAFHKFTNQAPSEFLEQLKHK